MKAADKSREGGGPTAKQKKAQQNLKEAKEHLELRCTSEEDFTNGVARTAATFATNEGLDAPMTAGIVESHENTTSSYKRILEQKVHWSSDDDLTHTPIGKACEDLCKFVDYDTELPHTKGVGLIA